MEPICKAVCCVAEAQLRRGKILPKLKFGLESSGSCGRSSGCGFMIFISFFGRFGFCLGCMGCGSSGNFAFKLPIAVCSPKISEVTGSGISVAGCMITTFSPAGLGCFLVSVVGVGVMGLLKALPCSALAMASSMACCFLFCISSFSNCCLLSISKRSCSICFCFLTRSSSICSSCLCLSNSHRRMDSRSCSCCLMAM
ncbi:hypothetical protein FF38_11173 [Lucilia cuprina]|uniref:Uncharacterized protein n=1 Tax=Lucilia cuprina TaxID=7375 RepID=A0A0L0BVW9_LUCCU|nr:hypothetical protein FF38_11173 [Lucilia cuprina]